MVVAKANELAVLQQNPHLLPEAYANILVDAFTTDGFPANGGKNTCMFAFNQANGVIDDSRLIDQAILSDISSIIVFKLSGDQFLNLYEEVKPFNASIRGSNASFTGKLLTRKFNTANAREIVSPQIIESAFNAVAQASSRSERTSMLQASIYSDSGARKRTAKGKVETSLRSLRPLPEHWKEMCATVIDRDPFQRDLVSCFQGETSSFGSFFGNPAQVVVIVDSDINGDRALYIDVDSRLRGISREHCPGLVGTSFRSNTMNRAFVQGQTLILVNEATGMALPVRFIVLGFTYSPGFEDIVMHTIQTDPSYERHHDFPAVASAQKFYGDKSNTICTFTRIALEDMMYSQLRHQSLVASSAPSKLSAKSVAKSVGAFETPAQEGSKRSASSIGNLSSQGSSKIQRDDFSASLSSDFTIGSKREIPLPSKMRRDSPSSDILMVEEKLMTTINELKEKNKSLVAEIKVQKATISSLEKTESTVSKKLTNSLKSVKSLAARNEELASQIQVANKSLKAANTGFSKVHIQLEV